MMRFDLTEAILVALSRLVGDAQAESPRSPSHSELSYAFEKHGLAHIDPKNQQTVGKTKRVRTVLSWALDNNPDAGQKLAYTLLQNVKVAGGFRKESSNYAGHDAILGLIESFKEQGLILTESGSLLTQNIEGLRGRELTDSLKKYADRARRGAEDAALLSGTSKDLLEATAAHVLTQKYGAYPQQANFPALLGQAFIALGMATPVGQTQDNEPPHSSLERGMFETAVGINRLRNKQGTGHGRPWIPSIKDYEAEAAIEMAGVIASYMLDKLKIN
ncbi:MAG: abortive infection family protein [Klebsiella sp.]|uniref:abortive infection family protein n=1 Tax=Klebsiella sp. TaxID=576 RepID=UPI002900ADE3|nr:abortive infection family protein [Klebsiella sp.]MDU3202830.1 abortive infection family protein [Klebsiella sp.]